VTQIREIAIVPKGEPERIEIVFEADNLERPHRAERGLLFVGVDGGHRVRRRAEADVPNYQRLRILRILFRGKPKPLREV
jgi:hypothetical protein